MAGDAPLGKSQDRASRLGPWRVVKHNLPREVPVDRDDACFRLRRFAFCCRDSAQRKSCPTADQNGVARDDTFGSSARRRADVRCLWQLTTSS